MVVNERRTANRTIKNSIIIKYTYLSQTFVNPSQTAIPLDPRNIFHLNIDLKSPSTVHDKQF